MTKTYEHSIGEILARLDARAVDLAHELRLFGRQSGAEYWVKDPRRSDGGNHTSFAINTVKGVWKNFAGPSDEGGDMLRLVAVFACNKDDKRAVKWALDWLGLTDKAPDPREAAKLVQQARARKASAAAEADQKRRAAMRVWLQSLPLTGADPASLYLRARGIDVVLLAGGIPSALRFDPACLALPENVRMPAMVACISGESGFLACHRTYLTQRGGVWGKAFHGEIRDGRKAASKRVLGAFAGGSIRLQRGLSGKPLRQAPADDEPMIGEGIENVLTAALAMPELRALSSVSGSNLGAVWLPPQIKRVLLLQDNDTEPQAIAMFDRAMDAYVARGIEPYAAAAPAGTKDMNEMVMA